jgi:hypothetical protein
MSLISFLSLFPYFFPSCSDEIFWFVYDSNAKGSILCGTPFVNTLCISHPRSLVTRSYPVIAISNGAPYMGDEAGSEWLSRMQSKQIVCANGSLLNATPMGDQRNGVSTNGLRQVTFSLYNGLPPATHTHTVLKQGAREGDSVAACLHLPFGRAVSCLTHSGWNYQFIRMFL